MLIECDYCGAPLDVKPNQATTKCAYCGKTSHIEQAHQVAQQTPNGWRPPANWTPPDHVPAPSGQSLKYHRTVGRVVMLAVVMPMVLTFGIGAAVFAATASKQTAITNHVVGQFSEQLKTQASTTETSSVTQQAGESQGAALNRALTAMRQATKQIQGVAGGATGENLFEGDLAEQLADTFAGKLGAPVKALEMSLYPTYAFLEAQNPQNASHVDKYAYRNGTIQSPEPVRLHLRGKLEDHLFSLSDVALDKIPSLIDQTLKTLNYEADAKPSHIIVERNLPFSNDVVIRVYVRSARDSGRVDYKADGSVHRVFE